MNPKKTLVLETNNFQETQALAQKIGSLLNKGYLFTLKGDLAAGKTTFTQGLAKGLNISDSVNSPTFVIMKEYDAKLPLIHIDAYRLEGVNQDLGFEDYIDLNHIVVIEWSQYLDYINEYDTQAISFQNIGENRRIITLVMDADLIDSLKELL